MMFYCLFININTGGKNKGCRNVFFEYVMENELPADLKNFIVCSVIWNLDYA